MGGGEMNKHLKAILTEMCKRVGTKFEDTNFKKANWFKKYKWARKQEKDFEKWMFNYFKENKQAYREMYGHPVFSDKVLKETISMFLFQYGWSYFVKEIKEK